MENWKNRKIGKMEKNWKNGKNCKRGISTSILTDVQCGGFVNFEARDARFWVWPPFTPGNAPGFPDWALVHQKILPNLACNFFAQAS